MPPLRELLAARVSASRRDSAARSPRDGAFSRFESTRSIRFSTTGRRSGLSREKWWLPFAPDGDVLYLLEENGVGADWVRNVIARPVVTVEEIEASARSSVTTRRWHGLVLSVALGSSASVSRWRTSWNEAWSSHSTP